MVAPGPPWLVLRPEHDEWDFLVAHRDLFDAVLIPEGHLAEYPKEHTLHGKDHERLLRAAKDSTQPVWRDPETPGLRSRTLLSLPPNDRRRLTPAVRLLAGRVLSLDMLEDRGFFSHFVDACLEAQADSDILVPPYLDFEGLDDLALQFNLMMVQRAAAAAANRPVTAIAQITNHRFLQGVLAEAAPLYAHAGLERVIIRVRNLEAQKANRDELLAYFKVIDAFAGRGIDVVADCVGRLGPVLIAVGASGFSTGTRFYRKVPYALLSRRDGGGGAARIGLQVNGSWSETLREDGVTAAEARVANLSTLRGFMEVAARDPSELVASLLGDADAYARIWGAVLREREQHAA